MRLIDADKLKVYLQEYLHYGHAIPWVDAQPTAYDVEKVVAELEKYGAYRYSEAGECWERHIYLDTAKKIVKRGGEK